MILINELKGLIVARGMTQKEVANRMGIAEKTLSAKLSRGVFGSDEIEQLIEILDIKNPFEIFFVKKVT